MYYNRVKLSRKNLILMFTFIIALILMSYPIDVSAKTNNPEVKISKKTLYVGYEQYKISVSNLAKGATVSCQSDNKSVAKVDKNNKVTGIKPGKATITVIIKQKGKTYRDSIAITVKAPYIKITDYSDTMKVNASKTWKAQVYGSANTTLKWSSSNPSVATVNRDTGKITAHSAGKASITVAAGSLKTSKSIVISESIPVNVKKETKEIMKEKDFVLQWDSYPKALPNGEFDQFFIVDDNLPSSPVWSVSNPNLASIDQDGWVNAADMGTGTVIVTVKVGNKQISAPLLILSDEDYIDYVNGYYTPNPTNDILEIVEDDSTQVVEHIPTPMPEGSQNSKNTPGIVVPKPTPSVITKPTVTPAPEENTSDYTYEKLSNGIIITGVKNRNIQDAVIPREINGNKVVSIKNKAFSNLEKLQSIVIPDTVSIVEYEAIIACPNLQSLTIPTSVTAMWDINDCPRLKYLTIGMEKVDGIKFRNCKELERITVLEGVKEISGFGYLHKIKEINLPQSLRVISYRAFTYCISLARINIPDGVTEIGEEAFFNCSSLTSLSISDSFQGSIGDEAFDETPMDTIGGAYKYGCVGILSDSEKLLLDKAQSIIGSVTNSSDTNGLKVIAIHDWIVRNTEYDYDNYLNGTVPISSGTEEGVLLYHRAVCGGYTSAFQLFMDLLNIPCETVIGMARGEGHAWNLVYLDGEWYGIDCTWDDPVPDKGPDYVGYRYCLVPDMILEQTDHVWDRTRYPVAFGTKWTDYVNDNLFNTY